MKKIGQHQLVQEDLEKRIKLCRYEIVSLDQDVKAKIGLIKTFSGHSSSLNQMVQSIRQKLNESEEKIAELLELSKGLPKNSELKDELVIVAIKRYKLETTKNLRDLREASRSALKNVEYEERSVLLSRSTDAGEELRFRSSKLSQQSVQFSDQLTDLLRQMDVQVRQSDETLKSLTDSSQAIGETEVEFRSMGATIASAGKLLSKLGRRELTDRILFFFALLFFFGVVFYIVTKRMF